MSCMKCDHSAKEHDATGNCTHLELIGRGVMPCSCARFVAGPEQTLPHLGEEELPSVLPSVEDVSLALGDRVLFRRPLVRKRERLEKERPIHDTYEPEKIIGTERYYEYRRDWVPNEHVTMWRPGIIIGKRTLQNGKYDHGGYDEQAHLYDISYLSAYLIAYDLHQKPVRVLEDDIKPL